MSMEDQEEMNAIKRENLILRQTILGLQNRP